MKYFTLILTLLLFSCAKEGKNIYIEGQVVNPITGEGIEGVRLVLHKEVVDFGSGSSSKIKETAYSDENGIFVLKHNGSLVNEYIVLIEYPDGTEGYHLVGWKDEVGNIVGGYQLPVDVGKLMKVSLELVPYANIAFNFNNINCFDSSDLLRFYVWDNYNTYLPGAWEHIGCVNFQGSGGALQPMGYYYMQWDVIRNNSTNTFYDTIFLNAGELKTYTVNY